MALHLQRQPPQPLQQTHAATILSISIKGAAAPPPPSTGDQLKTGIDQNSPNMSRRNGPKLDLKLNLSPPRANHTQVESPSRSLTVSPTSPPSSCVSSELNQDEYLRYSTSPEATSMMLVGCPRCLMYVMLAEEDPRCPKCKSTVLLDVIHDNAVTARKTKKSQG